MASILLYSSLLFSPPQALISSPDPPTQAQLVVYMADSAAAVNRQLPSPPTPGAGMTRDHGRRLNAGSRSFPWQLSRHQLRFGPGVTPLPSSSPAQATRALPQHPAAHGPRPHMEGGTMGFICFLCPLSSSLIWPFDFSAAHSLQVQLQTALGGWAPQDIEVRVGILFTKCFVSVIYCHGNAT